jgi:hypothetical protein
LSSGPYGGRRIGELAGTEIGRVHLCWLAENDTTYAGAAARTVLCVNCAYRPTEAP